MHLKALCCDKLSYCRAEVRVRILSVSRMITRAATPLIKMMTSDRIPPTTEAVSCPPHDVHMTSPGTQ